MALRDGAATVIIIDSDDEAPAPSNIRLEIRSGQTPSEAISLIDDDDDEIFLAATGNGAPRPPPAPHTTPIFYKSPAVNGMPRASSPAVFNQTPFRQANGFFESPRPALASRNMTPHSHRPVNSLLVGGQPQAQPQHIRANIPLPNFHQAPVSKPTARPSAQKANLARRPHPQGSQGSGSPDRKRLRMQDIPAYRAPSSGDRSHEREAMNSNGFAPPAALPNVQQAIAASVASNHNNRSPLLRRRNTKEGSNSPASRLVVPALKKGNCAVLIEGDIFPLVSQVGKTRLRHISADVHATINNTVALGNRAIYRILDKAQSLSELADQILANFANSTSHTIAQAVKTKFDESFQSLKQEHVNLEITEDRRDKWISTTVCEGIAICGKMSVGPEPIPYPMSPIAMGSPILGVNGILPSTAETQEDIDMIGDETPDKNSGTFLKKHEHYRDVDVLRYKGMELLEARPYITSKDLKVIQLGAKSSTTQVLSARNTRLVSLPFTEEEVTATRNMVFEWYTAVDRTDKELDRATRGSQNNSFLASIASYIADNTLSTPRRMKEEYQHFLKEVGPIVEFLRDQKKLDQTKPTALVRKRKMNSSDAALSCYKIQMLLRRREMAPNMERATQQLQSLVLCQLDDSFAREAEFSGGPGDISTFVWLSEDDFICGALTNGDLYNQDYNKPGNMVIGSANTKVARAIIGHRIPRPPKPQKDENAATETQDPWLYLSVPMTAYDADKDLCFTASYDKTVKVWSVSNEKQTMKLLATWPHHGPVNFVLLSPHHNKVATGSDVPRDGIRVYDLGRGELNSLIPRIYSGSRANDCANRYTTWAYHPATMQWGLCKSASHFLLVGYSARALDVHNSVSHEKRNSGQICVWNTRTRAEVTIAGPKTQNSFEVVWHPSQVVFVSATAATGEYDEAVKTQLRLFVYKDSTNVFQVVRTFECYGADINEITLRPSSFREFYLTASCTNAKTYVWDSAQADYPIHELCHHAAIDQLDENYDAEDVDGGVKFAAWGRTVDRFYTGSSDGAVKVWDIRAPRGEEFIEDILFAPGGISCGMFSPDPTRLAIGDTSGKIHLMKISDKEFDVKPTFTRTAIRPFYEPVTPVSGGVAKAREFVAKQQIWIHPDPYIGAVQGLRYSSTKLYRYERGIRRDLTAIPDEVSDGQKARRHRENLVLPRLLSVNTMDVPENYASGILRKLLDHHFKPEEASKIAHFCAKMNLSLPDCAELARAKVDITHEVQDDYEVEPEAADVFRNERMGGSIISKVDKKTHYLSKTEVQQFSKLRILISNESLTREAFQELLNASEALKA